ncbi:hypothetical protein WN51_02985 [Melipona quadrifasciata]|uniref:Uncharacterized protein n=1 Tax=Melipona quadrifasciata TaxID=166423 RepID=A0A0M8ZV98_9HYME|nr:hypothetical protein WN51_02985 [Melipona quadrifasciata]
MHLYLIELSKNHVALNQVRLSWMCFESCEFSDSELELGLSRTFILDFKTNRNSSKTPQVYSLETSNGEDVTSVLYSTNLKGLRFGMHDGRTNGIWGSYLNPLLDYAPFLYSTVEKGAYFTFRSGYILLNQLRRERSFMKKEIAGFETPCKAFVLQGFIKCAYMYKKTLKKKDGITDHSYDCQDSHVLISKSRSIVQSQIFIDKDEIYIDRSQLENYPFKGLEFDRSFDTSLLPQICHFRLTRNIFPNFH